VDSIHVGRGLNARSNYWRHLVLAANGVPRSKAVVEIESDLDYEVHVGGHSVDLLPFTWLRQKPEIPAVPGPHELNPYISRGDDWNGRPHHRLVGEQTTRSKLSAFSTSRKWGYSF
jgi:hypothetical protein